MKVGNDGSGIGETRRGNQEEWLRKLSHVFFDSSLLTFPPLLPRGFRASRLSHMTATHRRKQAPLCISAPGPLTNDTDFPSLGVCRQDGRDPSRTSELRTISVGPSAWSTPPGLLWRELRQGRAIPLPRKSWRASYCNSRLSPVSKNP